MFRLNHNVIKAGLLLICVSSMTTLLTLLSLTVEHNLKSFLSEAIINNHSFPYIHNPANVCTNNTVILLIVVPSAVANFEKRVAARKDSRGAYVHDGANNATMLFFLGKPSTADQNRALIQHQIDKEVIEFGDIVQEDFEDVYRNNRLKSVSMLRWISTHCGNAKHVIRSDDDVQINVPVLKAVMDRISSTLDNFMIGRKFVNDVPARNRNSKYYMSTHEYPNSSLPPYLLGGLVGYPVSTVKLLYQAALRVHPIWLEDVYISGLCAPRVNVPILSDPEFSFVHPSPVNKGPSH